MHMNKLLVDWYFDKLVLESGGKWVVKFEVGKRQNYEGVLGGNGPSIMRT